MNHPLSTVLVTLASASLLLVSCDADRNAFPLKSTKMSDGRLVKATRVVLNERTGVDAGRSLDIHFASPSRSGDLAGMRAEADALMRDYASIADTLRLDSVSVLASQSSATGSGSATTVHHFVFYNRGGIWQQNAIE